MERCEFQHFWDRVLSMSELCDRIVGFQDSIRKFVCHVVRITFQTIDKGLLLQLLGGVDGMIQSAYFFAAFYDIILKFIKLFCIADTMLKHWVKKYGWKEENKVIIFVANQDEKIKTKNITEKIDFDNVAGLMAACL